MSILKDICLGYLYPMIWTYDIAIGPLYPRISALNIVLGYQPKILVWDIGLRYRPRIYIDLGYRHRIYIELGYRHMISKA